MPKVPTLNGPQVRAQALPNARIQPSVTAESAGAGFGQGLERAGDAVAKIYQDERRKADELAVREADLKASKLETDILVQTKDYRGKSAAEAQANFETRWRQGLEEITKGLASEGQRQAFSRVAMQREAGIYRNVQ